MECEISSEEASWILAQMHISYTPGDTREKLKKRAFGYPEFISFVVDPNLVSDVLPRFFDAVASIDLNGIERVRSRIEGCDKIGSRTISFEDFQNIVGHVFASSASHAGSSPSEAQRLCAAYDVYGDGNVTTRAF